MADAKAKSSDEAILEQARKRFRIAASAENDRRIRQLADYKFSIGRFGHGPKDSYQWDEADYGVRAGVPTLTNNRIGAHCRQTVNQIAQGRQSPKVIPVDSGADLEKADVRQGVFRCIESKSKAAIAYMIATDHQVRMGEGFCRVVPEYVGAGPLQQLTIKAIRNRFSVYGDPKAQALDFSTDARYAFITEDLEDGEGGEYDVRYGGISQQAIGLNDFSGYGDDVADWFVNGHIRIAEYFYVESKWRQEPVQTRDGRTEQRRLETRTVHWVLMNGIEILDRRTLPISWIPVVRCVGEVTDIEGKVDYRGCVPDAIDPQKFLNYVESGVALAFATAPKAPYTGYAASFKGHPEWDSANTKNWAKLEANSIDPENKMLGLLPLPQRNMVSPEIQAMVFAAQRAENNLRAALGVNDVDSSERTKEQSGKAINARRAQNDLSNSHFAEHHALMVQQVGRILDAWVPFIYDAPRVMQIMGADERQKQVMVYAGKGMAPQEPPPEGVEAFDLKVGNYDIEISVGPSYQTRRQEAVEMMTQVITAAPELLKFMGDLYFGNMDWPEARQIGERFKKMLPPELQDDQKGKPEIPPEVQQQMQALAQQHELLTKELQAKTEEVENQKAKAEADFAAKQAAIQSNEAIKTAELESEERIAAAKLEQEYRLAVMKMEHEAKVAQFKAEQGITETGLKLQDSADGREHESSEGEKQRQHETQQHEVDLTVQERESQASREHEERLAKTKPKPNA